MTDIVRHVEGVGEVNLFVSPEEVEDNTLTEFLRDLRVIHNMSQISGEKVIGNFSFEGKDIGKEFPVIVVASRQHAILMQNGQKVKESFIPTSDIYIEIRNIVRSRQRRVPQNDARFGVSWLLLIPSVNNFAVFHPNTYSSMPVSREIAQYVTPIKERTSEAAKQLPYTRCLILTTYMKQTATPHPVPTVQPSKVENKMACTEDQLENAMQLFFMPRRLEEEVKGESEVPSGVVR